MRALTLLLAAVLSLAFAPAPLPRPKKAPPLEGTWALVSRGPAGKETPERGGVKVVIGKGRWAFTHDGKPGAEDYELVLNDRANPKTVDLKMASGRVVARGILVIEGDSLKFGYYLGSAGEGRPKAIDPTDSKQRVMTFKREVARPVKK
jgi:uncharacterized protein (TIGR03067 family)